MALTREFVTECYQRILEREPENDEVVTTHVATGIDSWTLIHRMIHSDEFKFRVGQSSAHSILKARNTRYLSKALNEAARFRCLIHNYHTLQACLREDKFLDLMTGKIDVLKTSELWPGVSVQAELFDHSVDEGEINLTLTYHGHALAVLAFTVVPADLFGLPGSSTFLVSRLQGKVGKHAEIRDVRRILGYIAPQYALVHVLEGIAMAQGVEALVGVNAQAQPSYQEAYASTFQRSYDQLFRSLGADIHSSGMFVLTLPRQQRPLGAVPISNRARTRAKRARKQELVVHACAQWKAHMH